MVSFRNVGSLTGVFSVQKGVAEWEAPELRADPRVVPKLPKDEEHLLAP